MLRLGVSPALPHVFWWARMSYNFQLFFPLLNHSDTISVLAFLPLALHHMLRGPLSCSGHKRIHPPVRYDSKAELGEEKETERERE